MKILFENKKQAIKVRIILWLAMLLSGAALYSGWLVFHSYGLAPADGGELKPFGSRLIVGGSIAGAGLAFCGLMIVYASIYVLQLSRDGEKVVLKTLSWTGKESGPWILKASEFQQARQFGGKLNLDISVDAPWINLHVSGRRLPLLLDMKAETIRKADIMGLCRH